jgi:cob(I)alamin adenosyltransferase
MVKLTKIYTRGGDKGMTSLTGGQRRAKYDLRVEAYGTVDEANSAIGIARLFTKGEADATLKRIQHDMFDLGADLSTPEEPRPVRALRIVEAQVTRLEKEIDAMNATLAPLNSFVLPGGKKASAHLHLARTIVRRAERLVCELCAIEPVNMLALHYLNRLSDHLFVMARYLNAKGKKDVLWQPGATRPAEGPAKAVKKPAKPKRIAAAKPLRPAVRLVRKSKTK